MRQMKDSGMTWIGSIPEKWSVGKLKYNLHREEPRNPGGVPVLSLYREYGVVPKDSRDDNHNVTSEDTSKYKYVRVGDFVINKMKAWQGSVAVSEYEGIVSPAYFVYRFDNQNIVHKYFHYLLRACYKDEFRRLSGGIREGQWDLPSESLDNTLILLPPVNEQNRIADFLDKKCAEIDSLTADVQKEIETLQEYRRSIITEVVSNQSEINSISKIKHVATFQPECKTNHLKSYDVVTYTPMDCIKHGYFIQNTAEYGSIPKSLTSYEEGDIVIAKVTPCFENGNIAIMNGLSNGIGFGSSELFVLRPTRVFDRYLFFWLQNSSFVQNGAATMMGVGGLKRVNSSYITNASIPVPSLEVQQRISAFLDKKCAEIDSIIELKQKQLDTLAEYRKSLIYEYVTGKKEVV